MVYSQQDAKYTTALLNQLAQSWPAGTRATLRAFAGALSSTPDGIWGRFPDMQSQIDYIMFKFSGLCTPSGLDVTRIGNCILKPNSGHFALAQAWGTAHKIKTVVAPMYAGGGINPRHTKYYYITSAALPVEALSVNQEEYSLVITYQPLQHPITHLMQLQFSYTGAGWAAFAGDVVPVIRGA